MNNGFVLLIMKTVVNSVILHQYFNTHMILSNCSVHTESPSISWNLATLLVASGQFSARIVVIRFALDCIIKVFT